MKRSGFKRKLTVPLKRSGFKKWFDKQPVMVGQKATQGVPKLAKKRKKRSPREILRDKAWATFSLWIRNRDKKCVTCGSEKNGQAGHRWHGKLDFDEININRQCSYCNKWRQGNLSKYDDYLISKYGIEEWNKLYDRKNKATAEYRTDADYQAIIEKYSL